MGIFDFGLQLFRRLARWRVGRFFLRWFMEKSHPFWPVERLYESAHLLAFYHPQPSYPTHVLIVPKAAYADLLAVPATAVFWPELLQATQQLVHQLELGAGYRLIVNGGRFQEMPLLHFHLVAG